MAKTKETQIAAIEKKIATLQQRKKALMSKNHKRILDRIVLLATQNGITAREILASLKSPKPASGEPKGRLTKRKTVSPKYKNPENPKQTWSGRGRMPLWVKALAAAGTLESARQ